MMHRPIGAQSHRPRPMATVDVFEILRVICRKSPIIIFQHLHCPYQIRPTACYRPLRSLMFNVTVLLISTTTQLQSDVDRIVHFRLTWYHRRRFDGVVIYFLKSNLNFFDDASRHLVDACNAHWYADRPIRRCIINLHRTLIQYPVAWMIHCWWVIFTARCTLVQSTVLP